MCVYICVCTCVCKCLCRGQGSTLGIFLRFSLNMDLTDLVRLLTSKAQGSPPSCLPTELELQVHDTQCQGFDLRPSSLHIQYSVDCAIFWLLITPSSGLSSTQVVVAITYPHGTSRTCSSLEVLTQNSAKAFYFTLYHTHKP